jgi:hypothetical protein
MRFTRIYAKAVVYNADEKTLRVTYNRYKTGTTFQPSEYHTYDEDITETFLCGLEYDYKQFEGIESNCGKEPVALWIFKEYPESKGKIVYITKCIDYPFGL